MYLKIQDLIKIKSYQGIWRKIDNSIFSSKSEPFHVKLNYLSKAGQNISSLNIYNIYIYIFLNLQNERNFNPSTVP